jgi:hypothetical protein
MSSKTEKNLQDALLVNHRPTVNIWHLPLKLKKMDSAK